MRALRSLTLVALLLAGCRLFDARGPNFVTDGTVVVVDDLTATGLPSDAITIDSVATDFEAPLTAVVRYGGGCRDHHVALVVERTFAESQPPVLRARLAHAAHGDNCKALLTRTVSFDLAVVRDHYRAVYGNRAGAFGLVVDSKPRVVHSFR